VFVREELLVNKLWGKNWSNQVGQTKLVKLSWSKQVGRKKVGQPKLVGPVVKKPVVGASTRELRKWCRQDTRRTFGFFLRWFFIQ